MFRIKICGIVCIEDVLNAACKGVDAVGFLIGITHTAEDKISVQKAREITGIMPGGMSGIMVTHLTDPGQIIPMIIESGCDCLQIQEDMDIKGLKKIRCELPGFQVIMAIHLSSHVPLRKVEQLIDKYSKYEFLVDGFILDSRNPEEDRIGGTGITNDWNAAQMIVKSLSSPVILAGGLNPENVMTAIRKVKPFGVDVNSGVERGGRSLDGKKDHRLLGAFIQNAREAFSLNHSEAGF